MYKKYLALALAAFLIVGTTACSKEEVHTEPTAQTAAHHWTYSGEEGPEHWGEIDPANTACVNGTEQSPIDIETAKVDKNESLGELSLKYEPVKVSLQNNGHTIQANVQEGNAQITIGDKTYKLAQFHFHLPSEHELDGKAYEMELHLVHKTEAKELAVLGVLLKSGGENTEFAKFWSSIPKEKTEADLAVESTIDLNALLPADKTYFRYAGSLTTPPCSQGVTWTVLKTPVEMSTAQIDAFKAIFPLNARPVQDLKSREVQTEK